MFVFRAMFWIAAVALLAPAERIGGEGAPAPIAMIETFRTITLTQLARVRTELAASDRRIVSHGDSV